MLAQPHRLDKQYKDLAHHQNSEKELDQCRSVKECQKNRVTAILRMWITSDGRKNCVHDFERFVTKATHTDM